MRLHWSHLAAFALGGAAFVGASYVLHCHFGLGPWACQSTDPRHAANGVH